ncbi:MAG: hypothetical protein VX733_11605 [Candidatus Latescibacterota bacterium]|nr:hypothetical protein [Candidatus Latescibacterota bacterium]
MISATLLSFGFGQLFKWSQRKGCHAPTVVTTNYMVLAACLALYFCAVDGLSGISATLTVGVAMGVTFIVSMLIMTAALERMAVGVVLTAFRLAILAPIVASVLLWGELVTGLQSGGIALAVVSLILMTWSVSRGGGSTLSIGSTLVIAFAVFFTQGLCQVCLRWVHYAGLDGQRMQVLMVCAATAGILGALFALVVSRRRPHSQDLVVGAGIGVFNLIALTTLLTALSQLEGTRFFPAHGCAVVLLDSLCARLWWQEAMSVMAMVGAVMAAASILLVL